MPRRRRLMGAVGGAAEGLNQVLGGMLQNRYLEGRQNKALAATKDNALLNDFNTEVKAMNSPEHVAKAGVSQTQAQYRNLLRRLPPNIASQAGAEPNFSALDTDPAQKLAVGRRRIDEATTPSGVPGEAELKQLLAENGLPATQDIWPKGAFDLAPGMRGPLMDSPEMATLKQIAEARKSGLSSEMTRTPVTNKVSGTTSFMTNPELGAAGPQKTDLTAQEEANKAGLVTTSQEQAKEDVAQRNARQFNTRAQAEAYAKTLGTQRANQVMGTGDFKPTTEVKEVKNADGSIVFKVIDSSPSQIGSETAGGTVPTTDQERAAYDYGLRGIEEHNRMLALEPALARRGLFVSLGAVNAPESLTDPVQRAYAQATRRFINAAMGRPESGGAITTDEFKTYGSGNAFAPGDDATSLANKQAARRSVLTGLALKSGPRYGKTMVTAAEVAADAAARGVTVDDAIKEVEAAGGRVIR